MKKTAQERMVDRYYTLENRTAKLIKQKHALIKIIEDIIYELQSERLYSADRWAYQISKDLKQALFGKK